MRDYSNYHTPFKDLVIESGKFIFEQQLEGFEGKEIIINGEEETRALINYHTNPMSDSLEDRELRCGRDVDIVMGDYVKIIEEDANYIVVTRVKQNELIKYTKILYCNNILTFQDKDTLEIYKIPCILQDKTSVYSDGIHKDLLLKLANDQIMITVKEDSSTRQVEEGRRLIFNNDDNAIYEVSRINTLTDEGIRHIVMQHSTYDSNTDSLELNIADYINPGSNSKPEEPKISDVEHTITIDGYDTIMFGAFEYYTVEVYQDNAKVEKTIKFELLGGEKLAWITDIETNQCKIYANKERKKGTVILRVSLVEDESVYSEKEIKMTAW